MGTAQPWGTEHGDGPATGTEHGTAQPRAQSMGTVQPQVTENGDSPTTGHTAWA